VVRVGVSPWWASVTIVVMGALIWLTPSGVYLLGFLGVVILSHEAGHLVVARASGMKPTAFFWGFGPEIVAVEHRGCRYGLKMLFLGGYVKLEGMTPSSELPPGFAEAGAYRAAGPWKRLATILAGPGVNLVMAAGAFAAAALIEGRSPGGAVLAGVDDVWFVFAATADALWVWVSNIGSYLAAVVDSSGTTTAPVRFMSPVAQAEVSRVAVEGGVVVSLRWFGVLSCAVGAVNLLPLPPLDGSHAVVAGAEGVIARVRPGHARRSGRAWLDVRRLVPLAYVTLTVLVFLSATALIMDLRTVS